MTRFDWNTRFTGESLTLVEASNLSRCRKTWEMITICTFDLCTFAAMFVRSKSFRSNDCKLKVFKSVFKLLTTFKYYKSSCSINLSPCHLHNIQLLLIRRDQLVKKCTNVRLGFLGEETLLARYNRYIHLSLFCRSKTHNKNNS
jgi:hypothetical protein